MTAQPTPSARAADAPTTAGGLILTAADQVLINALAVVVLRMSSDPWRDRMVDVLAEVLPKSLPQCELTEHLHSVCQVVLSCWPKAHDAAGGAQRASALLEAQDVLAKIFAARAVAALTAWRAPVKRGPDR